MLAARHLQQQHLPARLVFLGDRSVLEARAAGIGQAPRYVHYDPAAFAPRGAIEVWDHPVAAPPNAGHPDPTNARGVVTLLADACDACVSGEFGAMVTAPVQKSSIQDAGIPFSGHTEFLAQRTNTRAS